MTFWDHLDELRKVLIQPILLVAVLTVVAFMLKEPVFDMVLAANSPDFITYRFADSFVPESFISGNAEFVFVKLINTELASQFLMHMKVSFYVALVLAIPFLFYKLFRFVSPGLYRNERKYSKWVIFFSFIAFFCGIVVSYFIIFPFSFRFLASYHVSQEVSNMISLTSYIDTLITLSILMGIFFELPVMSWILSKFGLLNAIFLKKYRRHAVVVILIIAAIITPTTDIFTLLLVSVPILLLYETSVVIVSIGDRNRERKKMNIPEAGLVEQESL